MQSDTAVPTAGSRLGRNLVAAMSMAYIQYPSFLLFSLPPLSSLYFVSSLFSALLSFTLSINTDVALTYWISYTQIALAALFWESVWVAIYTNLAFSYYVSNLASFIFRLFVPPSPNSRYFSVNLKIFLWGTLLVIVRCNRSRRN